MPSEKIEQGKGPDKPESRYLPLSEANSDRLIINLQLPPFLKDRLVIDTDTIERTCNLIGIRTLTISNKDKSLVRRGPNVSGLTGSGAGIGVGRNKAEEKDETTIQTSSASSYSSPLLGYIPKVSQWIDMDINLDVDAVQKEVEKKGKGVNNADAWADSINKRVLNRLASNGAQHLLTIKDFWNAFFSSGYISTLNTIIQESGSDQHPVRPIALLIGYYLLGYMSSMINSRRSGNPIRFSVLGPNLPEVDRAALLTARTMLKKFSPNPLIKAVPKPDIT